MSDTVSIQISAGAWAKVADGPLEVCITGDDNFEFAEAPSGAPPAADAVGHFRYARQELVWLLDAGQGLYVRNAHRGFRAARNTAALS